MSVALVPPRSNRHTWTHIGKWHLGCGLTKPDCNQELRPGPLEIGLHQHFGLPATNDRISTVFVRDHRVVGLDCSEAIHYTYDPAEAKSQGMSAWVAGGKFPW